MRQGVDIPTLQLQLSEHKNSIRDYKGEVSKMSFSRATDRMPFLYMEGQGQFDMSPLFHEQVATHLEIPKKHYQRLMDKHPDIWTDEANAFLHDKEEQRLVRTTESISSGGHNAIGPKKMARAFLSTSYRRVDNYDVASWFLKAMETRGGAEIFKTASLQMTDNYLYMKMTMPGLTGKVRAVDDIIEAGLCLRNSEVGLGALKLERYYKRLVCKNGMVKPFMSMRHLGKKENVDTLQIQESNTTEKLEDALVISRLVDSIDSLMDKDGFEQELQMMRDGVDVDLSRRIAPPSKIVEVMGKRMGMSEPERETVFENWMRTSGSDGANAWSLANAVTSTADSNMSYDRATEFEVMGYKVLSTGGKEWDTIGREAESLAVAA
jgi:hypothetical protein